MTKEELEQGKKDLEIEYDKKRYALYRQYALANNPYNIGDIVTDHIASVKIEKIGIYVSFGESCCTYTGIQLNKDGKPNKRQDHTQIFQSNIINP